jgi:hypothetical protein
MLTALPPIRQEHQDLVRTDYGECSLSVIDERRNRQARATARGHIREGVLWVGRICFPAMWSRNGSALPSIGEVQAVPTQWSRRYH